MSTVPNSLPINDPLQSQESDKFFRVFIKQLSNMLDRFWCPDDILSSLLSDVGIRNIVLLLFDNLLYTTLLHYPIAEDLAELVVQHYLCCRHSPQITKTMATIFSSSVHFSAWIPLKPNLKVIWKLGNAFQCKVRLGFITLAMLCRSNSALKSLVVDGPHPVCAIMNVSKIYPSTPHIAHSIPVFIYLSAWWMRKELHKPMQVPEKSLKYSYFTNEKGTPTNFYQYSCRNNKAACSTGLNFN